MRLVSTRLISFIVVVFCVAPVLAQDQSAEEFRKLQGVWTVTAAEQNGRPFDVIKGGTLAIGGHSFSLKTAAGNEFKGELRVMDASTTPRQLDFIHANNGPVWEAIYSVTDDVFRMNYVEADGRNARPKLFATSADTPGTVIVLRRVATVTPVAQ